MEVCGEVAAEESDEKLAAMICEPGEEMEQVEEVMVAQSSKMNRREVQLEPKEETQGKVGTNSV